MFRATGKGLFEVDPSYTGAGEIHALLYNFDFDDMKMPGQNGESVKLKDAHIQFLDERVVPLLKNDSGQIWMAGSASRIGASAYNMGLSQFRVGKVQGHLLSRGVSEVQMQPNAVGENLATTHAADDQRDRAVELYVLPKAKNAPRPPRHVPRKSLVSRKFKLAMLTGFSAGFAAKFMTYFTKAKFGVGLAMDVIFFTIWDTTNNLACYYVYVGPIGLGVGLTFMPPLSTTTNGPWNDFTTDKPISVNQFGRSSRFFTASLPIPDPFNPLSGQLFSKSHITIGTPVGNVSEWIDTGTTIGLGLSGTLGAFVRIEGPIRFRGP
jgi:hypothetical protein